jgi:hypothetical protein
VNASAAGSALIADVGAFRALTLATPTMARREVLAGRLRLAVAKAAAAVTSMDERPRTPRRFAAAPLSAPSFQL